MYQESTRRIPDAIGAALNALGWLLAVASGFIGVVVFMSGVYGYVIAFYVCLPLCLLGLLAVALGRWLSKHSDGSDVEEQP